MVKIIGIILFTMILCISSPKFVVGEDCRSVCFQDFSCSELIAMYGASDCEEVSEESTTFMTNVDNFVQLYRLLIDEQRV
uniref:Uncharacterized protein n=1 Tax=Megaselia scalaris TaxID=36166 RepID=T1H4Q8_MEGSC